MLAGTFFFSKLKLEVEKLEYARTYRILTIYEGVPSDRELTNALTEYYDRVAILPRELILVVSTCRFSSAAEAAR